MMQTLAWQPIFLIAAVLTIPIASTDAQSRENASKIDYLYQMGMQLAEQDSLAAAVGQFQTAIELNKKHAPSFVGFGPCFPKAR